MITAPPAQPPVAEPLLPTTGDDLLTEGLHWLHDTPQPASAIIDSRGAAALTPRNRIIRWVPLAWGWKASIIVDVAHVDWGLSGGPLNPMPGSEILALAVELHHRGADIIDIRCRTTGLTATIALARPAHPTLRAAVRRYMQGCPLHHSRICGRPEARGGHNCTWYSDGQRGVSWPAFPSWPQHQHQRPDRPVIGIEVQQRCPPM
ncbi:hypothetical protein MAHJHV34_49250 [Mycobacterium avium subsp. hominissuis]